MHEIMHALGIFHEQSRADRDRFVKVNWENIIKGTIHGCLHTGGDLNMECGRGI